MNITRRSMIASLAALAAAPLDALVPAKPKTYGIVFDGVDVIPAGVPVEVSRDCRGRMTWIAVTPRGYRLWDGDKLIVVEAPL